MPASVCVLLVEDQPIILENLKEELEDDEFDVLTAYDAEEAREVLRQHAEQIAAAFIDIDLGPGENGYGLARYARGLRPGLPIVYTSGGVRGGQRQEAVAGSVFVAKPYRPREISALLKDMLSVTQAAS